MIEIRKIWIEGWVENGNGGMPVRSQGRWNFVVVDVVGNVVGTKRPRKYWNDFKKNLRESAVGPKDPNFQLSEKIGQLKIEGHDGKAYLTDVANLETTLQIIDMLSAKSITPISASTSARRAELPRGTFADDRTPMVGPCRRFVIKEAQKPGPIGSQIHKQSPVF